MVKETLIKSNKDCQKDQDGQKICLKVVKAQELDTSHTAIGKIERQTRRQESELIDYFEDYLEKLDQEIQEIIKG